MLRNPATGSPERFRRRRSSPRAAFRCRKRGAPRCECRFPPRAASEASARGARTTSFLARRTSGRGRPPGARCGWAASSCCPSSTPSCRSAPDPPAGPARLHLKGGPAIGHPSRSRTSGRSWSFGTPSSSASYMWCTRRSRPSSCSMDVCPGPRIRPYPLSTSVPPPRVRSTPPRSTYGPVMLRERPTLTS